MKPYVHENYANPEFCVIWLHGLGSDGNDMLGLAKQLVLKRPVKHICMNAKTRPVTINNYMQMRAWYDITGTNLQDREDEEGILESEKEIIKVLQQEHQNGFPYNKIFVAGFSQGGAMALFTALRFKENLAGVISLSSYLPLSEKCTYMNKNLAIFIGMGKFDTVVYPEWNVKTYEYLKAHGVENLERIEYPIAHSVSMSEIQDIATWLNRQIDSISAGE